jgi:hypothetical protein
LIWYWISRIIGLSSIGLNEMYCNCASNLSIKWVKHKMSAENTNKWFCDFGWRYDGLSDGWHHELNFSGFLSCLLSTPHSSSIDCLHVTVAQTLLTNKRSPTWWRNPSIRTAWRKVPQ